MLVCLSVDRQYILLKVLITGIVVSSMSVVEQLFSEPSIQLLEGLTTE